MVGFFHIPGWKREQTVDFTIVNDFSIVRVNLAPVLLYSSCVFYHISLLLLLDPLLCRLPGFGESSGGSTPALPSPSAPGGGHLRAAGTVRGAPADPASPAERGLADGGDSPLSAAAGGSANGQLAAGDAAGGGSRCGAEAAGR